LTFGQIRQYGLSVNFGPENPYGSLKKRFGAYSSIGVGLECLLTSNIGIALDWRTNFGSRVKQDILREFRQETGDVIGLNGQAADFYYGISGDKAMLSVRKILSKSSSGLVFGIGLGVSTNKIRIVDIDNILVPSVRPYSLIYDQFARGLASSQFIGYEFHSMDYLINGMIVFENNLNFTRFVRNVDWLSKEIQNDHSVSIRGRWVIPFKTSKNEETKDKIKYF
jgi:hypothetical protein